MSSIAFRSRPLPAHVADDLIARLRADHEVQPFSALDPRQSVRRVAAIAAEIGADATVYRGGLDLRGSEVDHVWLEVTGCVVDVAYPLFVGEFVEALREYVAGDGDSAVLDAIAATSLVEDRVIGEFPPPLRYLGAPVWSARGA